MDEWSLKRNNVWSLYECHDSWPSASLTDCSWPFFLFWRHHFWPKLASSILNFCRRKRSFQWCPDQTVWPNGALDMYKNSQNVEWKTQSKISCQYKGCFMLKLPVLMMLSQKFFIRKQAQKEEKRRKTKGEKKNSKNRKALRCRSLSCPKTISKFWFLRMSESQCTKTWCW